MEFKNPVLVVTDMDKTVEFYKRVFGPSNESRTLAQTKL